MSFVRKLYIQKETKEEDFATKESLDRKVGSVEATLRERVATLEEKLSRLEAIVLSLPTVKDTPKK
jgi:uncharacterized protein YheU (UPF0270 family)